MIISMKKLFLLACFLPLAGCVIEDNPTPECGKWELILNNPEATVVVENGQLVVDIPNPQSLNDVRLIYRQAEDYNDPKIGMGVKVTMEWTPVDGPSRDVQMRSSVVYQAQPDELLLEAVYGAYQSTYRVAGQDVFFRMEGSGRVPNEVLFYAEGEEASFERDSRTFPISPVSVAPKSVYLDFGINPELTRTSPTAHLRVVVDAVKFAKFTNTQSAIEPGFEEAPSRYGLSHDYFDCNSILP